MFNCDECCKTYEEDEEEPDTINGKGTYCSKCIDRMFQEDMICS